MAGTIRTMDRVQRGHAGVSADLFTAVETPGPGARARAGPALQHHGRRAAASQPYPQWANTQQVLAELEYRRPRKLLAYTRP